MTEPTESAFCTCERPLPVQIAERKGAARSVCGRCERPLRLRLQAAGANLNVSGS